MNKSLNLYIIIISFGIIVFSGCEDNLNPLSETNLNGKVKSIKEYKYNAIEEKFGKIEGEDLITIRETKYDIKGNNIEKNTYDSKGELLWKIIFNNDRKGNILDASKYWSNGKLAEKIIYSYDDKEFLIEENLYDYNGKLVNKYTYIYNSKGNVKEKIMYNENGVLIEKTHYIYDAKGNKVEENVYGSNNNLYYVYKYDSKSHLIEMEYYHHENVIFNSSIEYDLKGNKLNEIHTYFDEYGLITDIDKFSYVYEDFDKENNWLRSFIYGQYNNENYHLFEFLEREIEYY